MIIGIILLGFCVGDLKFSDIKQLAHRVSYTYLFLSLLSTFIFVALRALRWRIMINQQTPMPVGKSVLLYSAGQVLNIVMPALTGQVGRLILFSRRTSLGKTFIFSTIILEIVFDAVSLIIFVFLTSLAFAFPEKYRTISYIVAGATTITLIVLYLIIHYRTNLEELGKRRLKPIHPSTYITLKKFLRSFTKGIELLKSSQHVLVGIGLSLASWTFHMLALYFLFFSFGFHEPVAIAAAIMVLNTIILMIPITPGNAGTFEMAVSRFLLLIGTSSITRSDAVLYALALHIIDLIPVFVMGGAFMHFERVSLRQLKTENENEIILDKISEEGDFVEEGKR